MKDLITPKAQQEACMGFMFTLVPGPPSPTVVMHMAEGATVYTVGSCYS